MSHPTRVRGLKCKEKKLQFLQLMSHPTRVRGLKSEGLLAEITQQRVAPYTGAWIEISQWKNFPEGLLSHPTRVRGLKYVRIKLFCVGHVVAPYTGAWIEIYE